jgi:hypothetical protein
MVWLLVEEARDALPLPNHPQCERDVRFVISTSSPRAHPAQRVRSAAPKATSEHLLCKDRFWRICEVRWHHKVAGSALKSLKIFRTGRYQRFMFLL